MSNRINDPNYRMIAPMKMLALGGGALGDVEAKGVEVGAGSDRI